QDAAAAASRCWGGAGGTGRAARRHGAGLGCRKCLPGWAQLPGGFGRRRGGGGPLWHDGPGAAGDPGLPGRRGLLEGGRGASHGSAAASRKVKVPGVRGRRWAVGGGGRRANLLSASAEKGFGRGILRIRIRWG
ncbi:unnamed protein product, partial [Effrenium voratum]